MTEEEADTEGSGDTRGEDTRVAVKEYSLEDIVGWVILK